MTVRSAEIHERLVAEKVVRGSSDRSFGLVIAIVFGLLGLWPLVQGRPVRWWSLAVAAIVLLAALALPRTLGLLNRLWLKMGLLLHACINPVIMGLLFYTTVTPIGLLMRLLGRDLLRLRFDPDAPTYWIERCPRGPSPDTMPRQF